MSDPRDELGVHPRSRPGFGFYVASIREGVYTQPKSQQIDRITQEQVGIAFYPCLFGLGPVTAKGDFQMCLGCSRQAQGDGQGASRQTTSEEGLLWSPLICTMLALSMPGCRLNTGCLKDGRRTVTCIGKTKQRSAFTSGPAQQLFPDPIR